MVVWINFRVAASTFTFFCLLHNLDCTTLISFAFLGSIIQHLSRPAFFFTLRTVSHCAKHRWCITSLDLLSSHTIMAALWQTVGPHPCRKTSTSFAMSQFTMVTSSFYFDNVARILCRKKQFGHLDSKSWPWLIFKIDMLASSCFIVWPIEVSTHSTRAWMFFAIRKERCATRPTLEYPCVLHGSAAVAEPFWMFLKVFFNRLRAAQCLFDMSRLKRLVV